MAEIAGIGIYKCLWGQLQTFVWTLLQDRTKVYPFYHDSTKTVAHKDDRSAPLVFSLQKIPVSSFPVGGSRTRTHSSVEV